MRKGKWLKWLGMLLKAHVDIRVHLKFKYIDLGRPKRGAPIYYYF